MKRKINFMGCMAVAAALAVITGCAPKKQQYGQRVYAIADALADEAWGLSKWISVVDAPVVEGKIEGDKELSADGASWFVSNVKNEAKVEKAVWITAGLGVYELYVNGKPIGEEILKPGFTHHDKTKRSFTYDVTDAFNTGAGDENQLAVQVTPGWWADKIVTPWGHDGMIGRKCAFRGVLELTFADGTKQCMGTDTENWKAGIAGPVKHAGIFDGDNLLVAKQNTASNGEIIVAMVEDSATVKRFYKENGHYRLQPENDSMDPIIVDSVEILGQVKGLIRMM